ncbi:hypothetical protein AG4045_006072 [Apium graveolens]|uniref:Uncharacterized protein n=1 Tax=Apium graveolens TaxID=4045 RepID=A0A6L5B9F3_APIGR|nr:hypothetical protein AG4045_006072 [Apium graveolens]
MSDQPSSDDGGPSSTQDRMKILIRSTDSENETPLHLAIPYNREDVPSIPYHDLVVSKTLNHLHCAGKEANRKY